MGFASKETCFSPRKHISLNFIYFFIYLFIFYLFIFNIYLFFSIWAWRGGPSQSNVGGVEITVKGRAVDTGGWWIQRTGLIQSRSQTPRFVPRNPKRENLLNNFETILTEKIRVEIECDLSVWEMVPFEQLMCCVYTWHVPIGVAKRTRFLKVNSRSYFNDTHMYVLEVNKIIILCNVVDSAIWVTGNLCLGWERFSWIAASIRLREVLAEKA